MIWTIISLIGHIATIYYIIQYHSLLGTHEAEIESSNKNMKMWQELYAENKKYSAEVEKQRDEALELLSMLTSEAGNLGCEVEILSEASVNLLEEVHKSRATATYGLNKEQLSRYKAIEAMFTKNNVSFGEEGEW